MLAAVTLVLGLTNIGIIPIPPANVTTMHIPVIIGAILCGPKVGLFLGAVFGLTSVWKAFTATSSLVAPLLAASPVLVIVMSLGSRLLVPVVAGAVYRGIGQAQIDAGGDPCAGRRVAHQHGLLPWVHASFLYNLRD